MRVWVHTCVGTYVNVIQCEHYVSMFNYVTEYEYVCVYYDTFQYIHIYVCVKRAVPSKRRAGHTQQRAIRERPRDTHARVRLNEGKKEYILVYVLVDMCVCVCVYNIL
jgi:hypothetical protein